jgi:hypothetical protein
MIAPRVWTIGDPEPEDHPHIVAGDAGDYPASESAMQGPFHYRWEDPCEDNGWCGGWWCVEYAGDLYDWDQVLKEEGILTEELET